MSYKPIALLWGRGKLFTRRLDYVLKLFFSLGLWMLSCSLVLGSSRSIFSEKDSQQIPQRIITGVVVDEQDRPISGATVLEMGTGNRVGTNQDGSFRINISKEGSLVVSYVGYLEYTLATEGKNSLRIVLKEDQEVIEDVVVVGYGTMRKKDLTGSISHVDADKLRNERPTTVQDILRNTAPGLVVAPSSSSAKEEPSLLIRGQRSLKGGTAPLIVLNGVIFNGELSEINPNDIESIDVLKDASSAAIFGAKSANGVVIVSTKKGSGSKPTILFDSSLGLATMGVNRKYYTAEDYLQYRSDYAISSNGFDKAGFYVKPTPENLQKYNLTEQQWRNYDAIGQGSDQLEDVWLQRINLGDIERTNYFSGDSYNWYDESWQTAPRQNYNLSLSGQTPAVKYYWSMGYQDNKGNQVGDRFKNYRSNFNLEAKVTSFIDAGVNLNLQKRDEGFQAVDWEGQSKNSPYSTPFNEDGSLNPWPMGQGHQAPGSNSLYLNSMSSLSAGTQAVNANFFAKVTLPFNITYQMNFAPRFSWNQNRNWRSSGSVFDTTGGYANRNSARSEGWTLDNIIKWNYTFEDKHFFDVTLLQNAEKSQYWSEGMTGTRFSPADILEWHSMQSANERTISSNDEKYTGDALMARLFYSYDNRYMLTGSVRRDGFSAFGRSKPRANFPSLAFAWAFSEESFFNWPLMSQGKLRLSYGQNGNRDIGIYQALSQLITGSGISRYTFVTSTGTLYELSTLQIERMANNDLKWESTASWNLGLDFGFLSDRINGSLEWYYMPTTDLLMDRTLPNITGYTTVVTNLGKVVNQGFELALNTINIDKPNFHWTSGLNLSHNKNRIEHLYYTYEDIIDEQGNITGQKEVDDIGRGWFVGKDMSTIWDYEMVGIWQQDEADQADKYGQKPGDAKARDIDNDNRISGDDRTFLGQRTPKVRIALRNDFRLFDNWSLSFNLYSYLGHKSATTEYLNFFGFDGDYLNSPVRDYWTPENSSNEFARLKSTLPGNVSPKKVINMDFIRLENISLGYRFPQRTLDFLNAQEVRIFGTVRNAAIWAFSKSWSRANYWDVETGGSMPRTFTLGASITF